MTYYKYQWTAFTEADLLANGMNGTDFGCGDRFVMPRCATVTMSTYDDDGALEGDNSWWYGNDQSEDRYGQDAYLNGSRIGCKMYAEQYHVLQGSNGCTYYLIEIKVEGHDSAGAGNGYFTFYGATPPAGVTLTVTQTCNVSGCWVNYSCLGAGNTAPPNTPPTFTNVPADGVFCVPENTKLVVDLNASDANNDTLTYSIVGGTDAGKFVIDANTGVLNFVTAPDYEAPGSSDGDNSYQVIVAVSDGKGGVTNKCLTVNVCNVDEGTTPPTCTIIQAEDMQLCGFAVGSSSNTSGGKFIYTLNNGVTYATTTYTGAAGTYDLTLRSFDQIGESYVSVWVNGVKVGSYGELNDDCNWEEHVLKNVQLKPGDVIEIRGSDCGTNYIDYLKICPSGPTTGALEGRVFVDANKNGLDDAEAGVGGVTVQLLDSTGRVVGTTTTAADGSYKFDNLAPGNYTVAFPTTVNGKVLTTQNVGSNDAIDSDANVSTGQTGSYSVVAGQTTKDVDAGVKDPGTASLEGRAFVDANKDGVDNNEAGVAGQTVKLVNAAGVVIATTTTAADGSYKFTGLDAGSYSVIFPTAAGGRVLTGQNVGADDTIDSDASISTGQTGSYTVAIGQNVKDVDAGYKDPGTASLEGRAFVDANKDGVDNNEAGVAGQTVQLVNAAGVVIATTTTAADGSYKFTGLDAGSYSVIFPTAAGGRVLTGQNVGADDTIDSDASISTGQTGSYTVAIGQNVKDVDAGYKDPGTASLGDRVWFDLDRDGVQDAGEAGAAGVTVTLYDAAGNAVRTTTTDANGKYLFTGLDAGNYSVGFGEPAGFDLTQANAGANDGVDSDANPLTGRTGTITLAIGETNLSVDAGLVRENRAPVVVNDTGHTCADEVLTVNVLANDSDPDGDSLTITSVAGQAISEGQTITTATGVKVTLQGGQLVVDGETAYAALDIGQKAIENIAYTVSDGQGGSATGNLQLEFCGDANSVESFCGALPDGTISYKVQSSNIVLPIEDFAFNLQLINTGDHRLDGVVFESAYCIDRGASIRRAETLDAAPVNQGKLICADDPAAAGAFDADQFSFYNGKHASENLDLISWIMNQDFANDGTGRYSEWEVQRAIWELTNGDNLAYLDGVNAGFGSDADVKAILAEATLQGEGFHAGVGDTIAVIVDPGNLDARNLQPIIIGMDFETYDCLC